MNTPNTEKPWDVAKATRDAIVGTAASIEALKEKTAELARDAEKKWQESKPGQQKAKDALKKAAGKVSEFGHDFARGVKQGIQQVQKGGK